MGPAGGWGRPRLRWSSTSVRRPPSEVPGRRGIAPERQLSLWLGAKNLLTLAAIVRAPRVLESPSVTFAFLTATDLAWNSMMLIVLLLSLTVHEWAHAISAWWLGDDTAARMGRLTLNPIAHMDPIGTLLLPLLGIPFGWAKPVPVNPARFKRGVSMTTGMMITAAAGPISNIILAVVCSVIYGGLLRFDPELLYTQPALNFLLSRSIMINVVLALFNLLPIPPLDGSRIVEGVLPYRMRPQWEQFARFAPLLLLGVFFFGGRVISGPVSYVQGMLHQLMMQIAVG